MKKDFCNSIYDPYSDIKDFEQGFAGNKLIIKLYEKMLIIRLSELCLADLIKEKKVKTPCHLAIGQEAVPVGISANLTNNDKIFGCHRSHSHYLALGGSPYKLFAEILGKETGLCKGMGGSMHIYDPDVGLHGTVPIVGATIPIAAGAALAHKMQKSDAISVAYFGDGACEEGVLHETLNLASIFKLPILFVCENNLFSSHLNISLRQPTQHIARFADAHCIKNISLDGNDISKILTESKLLIDYIRKESKPAFIEGVSFRWCGHVGANDDIDVGVNRKMSDVIAWKKRDPIDRLKKYILNNNISSEANLVEIENNVHNLIKNSVDAALKDVYPKSENILNFVYNKDIK